MNQRSTRFSSQRGVHLIIFSVMLIFMLGIAALAFDGAILYIARLRLVRAIDNALVAAPMMMMGTANKTEAQVKDGIEKRFFAQISLNYSPADASANVVVPNLGDASISASLTRRLYLASAVFKGASSSVVNYDSQILVPRVNIAIVLDCSESMNRMDPLVPGQLKIGTALAGGSYATNYLCGSFDRISVLRFDDEAKVMVPFNTSASGGFNQTDINNTALTLITPPQCDNWSDFSDALKLSGAQHVFLRNALSDPLSDELNVVVAFTDGLVSHAKFFIPNGAGGSGIVSGTQYHAFISNLSEDTTSPGTYNTSGYTLRSDPLTNSLVGISQGYSDLRPICESDTGYPASTPPDHSACFSSGFSFISPSGAIVGPASDANAGTVHGMMFLKAISEADNLRTSLQLYVYSFVVGDAASPDSSRFDVKTLPFTANTGLNKADAIDVFMRRVTIPPEAVADPSFKYIPSATAEYTANKKLSGDSFRIKSQVDAKRGTRSALGDLWFRKMR